MAAESCHPRGLSGFARSCIPADPAHHTAVRVPMPVSAPNAEYPGPEPKPPITALPDELLLEILARVPCASLPTLPTVYCRFAYLLASHSSTNVAAVRGHAAAAGASGGVVEGLVLVYDIGGGRRSCALDLSPGFQRVACDVVEY